MFVLGPHLDSVIEPDRIAPPAPGQRTIEFRDPATSPGGVVHVTLLPRQEGDAEPVNVYAFFVQPAGSVPPPAERTPEFFCRSGAPSGSIRGVESDADGLLDIRVPNVKPSLQPYFVQTILEYPG